MDIVLPVFSALLLVIGVLLMVAYAPAMLALATTEWWTLLVGALLFGAGTGVTLYLLECLHRHR